MKYINQIRYIVVPSKCYAGGHCYHDNGDSNNNTGVVNSGDFGLGGSSD